MKDFIPIPDYLLAYIEYWIENWEEGDSSEMHWICEDRLIRGCRISPDYVEFMEGKVSVGIDDQHWWLN